MMNFRTLKQNVVSILSSASSGRFEVIQSQQQRQGSKDINTLKKVIVYFVSDDFPENTGSANGELQSKPTFRIFLEVASKGKFTDKDDPSSLISADLIADDEIDELIEIVFQILMDARNIDLGMSIGQVSGRYIKNVQKSTPNKDGENVIMMAQMDLTCMTSEEILGDEGVEGTNIISSLNINGDTFQQTGIQAP